MLIDIRMPLHPPTEFPSDDEIARTCAYLDGQSRIDLAVWVRHEQKGVDGPLYDHHVMLGLADEDYENGDPDAILFGVERELGYLGGWTDLFPLSEVETLREFGHVLWERDGRPIAGLDPLNFRWVFEPVEPSAEALEVFRRLIAVLPAVVRVEATHQRLLKDDQERYNTTTLYVLWDTELGPVQNALAVVGSAAAEAGISYQGLSAGIPSHPDIRTTVLYDAEAAS
jgi:hypothetical protein